ncbi:hypothetical protein ACT453_09060 [Bacillus sp. D-CC]
MNGNLKHADDFYFEVALEQRAEKKYGQKTVIIPLYYLMNIDEIERGELPTFVGGKVCNVELELDVKGLS